MPFLNDIARHERSNCWSIGRPEFQAGAPLSCVKGRRAGFLEGIATTLTGAAMRCSALLFNRARRSSSLHASPPTSVCLDIFLLPSANDVATHVERLNSNETNKVAQSSRLQVRSETERVVG